MTHKLNIDKRARRWHEPGTSVTSAYGYTTYTYILLIVHAPVVCYKYAVVSNIC